MNESMFVNKHVHGLLERDYVRFAYGKSVSHVDESTSFDGTLIRKSRRVSSEHYAFLVDHEPIDVKYLRRFKELIVDADDDGTSVDSSAIADFMRFLDSPVVRSMERGLMGASPTGGITVTWSNSEHRLSVKFGGRDESFVVEIAPDKPTTLDVVSIKGNLDSILEKCTWARSKKNITSSNMPVVADWKVKPSSPSYLRKLIGQQTG